MYKKIFTAIIFILCIFVFTTDSYAKSRIYIRNCFVGGTIGCLDALDGALPSPTRHNDPLQDGDMSIVITRQNDSSFPFKGEEFTLDADSGVTESTPWTTNNVIAPDTNPGTKRWIKTNRIGEINLCLSATPLSGNFLLYDSVNLCWDIVNHTGNTDAHHAQLHTVASHNDTSGTGPELDTLTDGSNADSLHDHTNASVIVTHASTTGQTTDDHHAQTHTIVSHDTGATGAELDTLTDDSMADAEHRHSGLSASDGTPDNNFALDADGNVNFTGDLNVSGEISIPLQQPTLLCSSAVIKNASDVAIGGGYAYVAANYTGTVPTIGIAIVNKHTCDIVSWFTHDSISAPHSLIYDKGFLFVQNNGGDRQSHIVALDVNQGASPKFASKVTHTDYIDGGKNLQAVGNVLISGANLQAFFWDMSDPYNMKFLSTLDDATGTSCNGGPCLKTAGVIDCAPSGLCLMGSGGAYVSLVDMNIGIDGTTVPKILSTIYDATFLSNMNGDMQGTCTNERCFVASMATSDDVVEIDISDPLNISIISGDNNQNPYSANSLDLMGDVLWMANEAIGVVDGSIRAVDVGTRGTPSLLYNFVTATTGGASGNFSHRILTEGNRIYVVEAIKVTFDDGRLKIYTVPGLNAKTGYIGGLRVGTLDVNQRGKINGNLIVGGSADMGGDTFIRGDLGIAGGFAVQDASNYSTPTLSYDGSGTASLAFYHYLETLYAGSQGDGALLKLCCGNTDGAVWNTADLSAIGGLTPNSVSAICEYDGELIVGTGIQTDDPGVFRCDDPTQGGISTLCDHVDDFADTGLVLTGYEQVHSCIGWHNKLFVTIGNDVGQGEVRVCNKGDAGSATECDLAGDWSTTLDDGTAAAIRDIEAHGDYLYAAIQTGATDSISICDEDASGDCVWATALSFANSGDAICTDLVSDGGALYVTCNSGIWRCIPGSDGKCNSFAEWGSGVFNAGPTGFIEPLAGRLVSKVAPDVILVGTNDDAGVNSYHVLGTLGSNPQKAKQYNGSMFIGLANSDYYVMPLRSKHISKYMGDTTEGNGVGSIVDYVTEIGKVADITETNLFIPPTDGLYKVTIYAIATTVDAGDTLDVDILYTDAAAAQTRSNVINALDLGLTTPGTAEVIVQANSSDPITYQTDYTDDGGTAAIYNLYITVERLN